MGHVTVIGAVHNSFSAVDGVNAILRELSGMRQAVRSIGPQRGTAFAGSDSVGGKSELTEEERRELQELKRRDGEVRQHEAAHKASAGQHARGSAQFEYTTGPDGRRYATGGEVQIDASAVPGDAQATIRKMQQIRRAAGAPAKPSAQDRQVAAQAAQTEARARVDLAREHRDSREDHGTSQGAVHRPAGSAITAFFSTSASHTSPGHFIDVRA